MTEEPADDRPPPGPLFRKIFGIPPDPPGETGLQRLERARAWLSSESPQRRRHGLSMLAAMDREEAVEPCFAALKDPDKKVRTMGFIVLLGYDPPSRHGDRIVSELGGERSAAAWWVEMRLGAGSIGSFGLTQRFLPYLDEIARDAKRRRHRRTAGRYAHALRQHPRAWPLLHKTQPDNPAGG